MSRPYLKIPLEERLALVKEIYERGEFIQGTYQVKKVEEDSADDKFIACALEGKVDYLVSGAPHLKKIKYYHGIQIISIKDFLRKLG
ncbi:MAG: hypothetical protein AB1567_07540 [bacterium]